jgi:hypothetical protein
MMRAGVVVRMRIRIRIIKGKREIK